MAEKVDNTEQTENADLADWKNKTDQTEKFGNTDKKEMTRKSVQAEKREMTIISKQNKYDRAHREYEADEQLVDSDDTEARTKSEVNQTNPREL